MLHHHLPVIHSNKRDSEFTVIDSHAISNVPCMPISCLLGHDGSIHALKFTHDGTYCLTAGQDRTVRLWNPIRKDPAFPVTASSKNQSIISSSTIRLYDKKTNLEIPRALPIQVYSDGHTHSVSSVDIDDTSTTLLSSSDKAVVVTDVITKKLKRRLTGHTARVNAVQCSLASETFISASYDATVRIWDGRSSSSTPIQILSHATDSVSCVAILQDTRHPLAEIITGSIDGCIRTYDLRRGILTCDSLGKDVSITSLCVFSEYMCIAASCLDGNIHILDRRNGDRVSTISHHDRTVGNYALNCCVTADDTYIGCGSENGDAVIYDIMSGKPIQTLLGHTRPTCSVICHPQVDCNALFVTGSYDGLGVVWSHDDSILRSE